MATLQLPDKQAREIYPTASAELKSILENSFGKTFFSKDITDRINSFEDACGVLAINPFDVFNPDDTADEIAYRKLKIITKAYNEGWEPDWNNKNEYKWYLWFYMDKPGFRLYVADHCCASSTVGSRLCFKSEKLALDAAKKFESIYKQFFTL
jgi:hypothetical protein